MYEKSFNKPNELLERERALDTTEIEELIFMFWDLHFLRRPSDGYTIEPFDPVRIKTHMELKCEKLSPWEYKVLMDMDLTYRAKTMENRK